MRNYFAFYILNTFWEPFYPALSLAACVKGEIIQTFIIMHNYETILIIILGNFSIYVVKLKKSENNSAIIATALRLLVTWPTAWDAPNADPT